MQPTFSGYHFVFAERGDIGYSKKGIDFIKGLENNSNVANYYSSDGTRAHIEVEDSYD